MSKNLEIYYLNLQSLPVKDLIDEAFQNFKQLQASQQEKEELEAENKRLREFLKLSNSYHESCIKLYDKYGDKAFHTAKENAVLAIKYTKQALEGQEAQAKQRLTPAEALKVSIDHDGAFNPNRLNKGGE